MNKMASIVLGLMWGDEGKGKTTDYLCSMSPSEKKIVVRFSGGQQAGHNVVINGINHVHSNFGSGTLRGVPSYFSEHCTIYPITLYNEEKILKQKNIVPELYIHPLAKLTTPFDVVFNRITERKNQHGSCGLGIGTTMSRNNDTPHKLFAVDLLHHDIFLEKLHNIRTYYLSKLGDDRSEFIEATEELMNRYLYSIINFTFRIRNYNFLKENFDYFVFEGSQGILLDMDHGIYPHVTYSNTTSKNALEICEKLGINDIEIFYVTRCYQTRHGNGWMSNEENIELINTDSEINLFNEFQKDFRIGEIDYELINHSLIIDDIYSYSHKKNLMITCLDQRPLFDLKIDRIDIKRFKQVLLSYSPDTTDVKSFLKF